jgi:hypothetical protein
MIDRPCEFCGTPFRAKQSEIDKGGARFCSRACVGAQASAAAGEIDDRFWARVNKNGSTPAHRSELGACWVWVGAHDRDGYGMFNPRGGTSEQRAHRWSWLLNVGSIPDGDHVLHRCDNPPCIRPEHLFTGTELDNARDKVAKDRHAYGEHNANAKLTADNVVEMRRRYAEGGVSYRELAEEYGLQWWSSAKNIIRRRSWKHV